MKENKLVELSMDFSVEIINLVKFLKANHETIISNQIRPDRSASSAENRILSGRPTKNALLSTDKGAFFE